jgi:putative oxidoreductase
MTTKANTSLFHITLWIVQLILAAAFGMAGFMKITAPITELAEAGMTFVNKFPVAAVRLIGFMELLGAVGLILPAALRIKPVLTPLAALGFALIMLFAALYHLSQQESIFPNAILLFASMFIVWGRFVKVPVKLK